MASETAIDLAVLRQAIKHEYEEVAICPTKGYHFHTGRVLAALIGYPAEAVDPLPDSAVESFAGVGNPFALGNLNPGEVVLDLGSGAGFDSILAAQQVGPSGKVIGVDMTPAMLAKARANVVAAGLDNVEFHEAHIEELPLKDGSIDVVISNGVINLSPDKETVFAEAYRVLKPGGRMQVSDIIVERQVPEPARSNIDLWTG
jgi:SAM-dependent methyltransferase